MQQTTNWVVLIGHWDVTVKGIDWTGVKMNTPVAYWHMATACPVLEEYYSRGRMKYVTGHSHCNVPNPYRHPQAKPASTFPLVDNKTGYDGFLLGGMGMYDGTAVCGGVNNYGPAVMATTPGGVTGDRLELVYFKVGQVNVNGPQFQYEAIDKCVTARGWRECAVSHPELADVWLNVTAPLWETRQQHQSHNSEAEIPVYV